MVRLTVNGLLDQSVADAIGLDVMGLRDPFVSNG
jgi:hypothetical protein